MASISLSADTAPQTPIASKVAELRIASEDAFNTALALANLLSAVLDENPATQPAVPSLAEPKTTVCELHERLHGVLVQVRDTVSLLQRIANAVQL